MNQQDSLEAQVEAANKAARQLRSELKSAERQIARLLELVEKHQNQLTSQESSIARLDRILMELLTGRTWRTLRAIGNLIKKLAPSRPVHRTGTSIALTRTRS